MYYFSSGRSGLSEGHYFSGASISHNPCIFSSCVWEFSPYRKPLNTALINKREWKGENKFRNKKKKVLAKEKREEEESIGGGKGGNKKKSSWQEWSLILQTAASNQMLRNLNQSLKPDEIRRLLACTLKVKRNILLFQCEVSVIVVVSDWRIL